MTDERGSGSGGSSAGDVAAAAVEVAAGIDDAAGAAGAVTAETPEAGSSPTDTILADAREGAFLEALSEGTPDAATLREYYGEDAGGLTDEQLLDEWKAQSEETAAEDAAASTGAATAVTPSAPTSTATKLPFEVVDADEKTAPAALKVKYSAGGKEVIDDLPTLVRKSQRMVLVDQQITNILKQRNELADGYGAVNAELVDLKAQQKVWQRALSDPSGEKMRALQEKYQEALLAEPEAGSEGEAAPIDEAKAAEVGKATYDQHVKPAIASLAQEWAPEGRASEVESQLEEVFQRFLIQEGPYMRVKGGEYTAQRVREVLQTELPAALEHAGYIKRVAAANGNGKGSDNNAAVAALQAENRALKARIAQQRLAEAPGDGGSGAGTAPASASRTNLASLDKAKSWAEMKDAIASGTLAKELGE